MIEDLEFCRIQKFAAKYKADLDALTKSLEEYKKSLEAAENNYKTFINMRQAWIVRNIHMFLKELPDNTTITRLDIVNGNTIALRAYTLNNTIIEYDIKKGWQDSICPSRNSGGDCEL